MTPTTPDCSDGSNLIAAADAALADGAQCVIATGDYHPHALRENKVRDVMVALVAGCSVAVDPQWILPPLDPVAQAALEHDELFARTRHAIASSPHAPLAIVAPYRPRLDLDLSETPKPFRLVAGSFVLYASLQLKRPIAVALCHDAMLEPMTRRLLARNPRSGVAAIEWGVLFRRALACGVYESQARLAQAIGWPRSAVQRAVKIASLPEPVLQAFGAPQRLRLHDAELLNQAVELDEAATIAEARAIAGLTPRPDRPEVLRRLRAAAGLPTAPVKSTTGSARAEAPAALVRRANDPFAARTPPAPPDPEATLGALRTTGVPTTLVIASQPRTARRSSPDLDAQLDVQD